MKKVLYSLAIVCLVKVSAHAWVNPQAIVLPNTVVVSSVTPANAVATVTVTTPTSVGPYSAGYYNYVTHIRIEMYATGTLTGGASPVTCTTTNLNGIVFKLPTAAATGTTTVLDQEFTTPIQGVQGSTITLSCPATASVIWNVQLATYSGQ